MIFSEDIRSNEKFPGFIRRHTAFRGDIKYHKVFPKIGLENFEIKLSKTKYPITSAFKLPSFNINALITGIFAKSVHRRLVWKTLGSMLAYFSTFCDLIIYLIHKQNDQFEIVFASDYADGTWDIATMSMRGAATNYDEDWTIYSPYHLIGSIIDPCCGIIYLTDGKPTNHGSNMLYRAVVRYVIHKYTGPCLFLEKISCNKKASLDKSTLEFIFANELNKRSGLPVVSERYHLNGRHGMKLNEVLSIPSGTTVRRYMVDSSKIESGLNYKALDLEFEKFSSLRDVRQIITG